MLVAQIPRRNITYAIKYELECGDILISLTGNVGRVAIITTEFLPAALNQRVACLRIKNEILLDKSFLFLGLISHISPREDMTHP